MAQIIPAKFPKTSEIDLDFIRVNGQHMYVDQLIGALEGYALEVKKPTGQHEGLLVFIPSVLLRDLGEGR